MLAPVIVDNVKSVAFCDGGVESDGVEEFRLRAIPTMAPTAIITIISINQVFLDILPDILITSWHKPAEILQVTGQHQNAYGDKQHCGYYGGHESMAT